MASNQEHAGPFRFLDLPTELRIMIYPHALPRNKVICNDEKLPGLLTVSKFIRKESTPIYYSTNSFHLSTAVRGPNIANIITRLRSLDLKSSSFSLMTSFVIQFMIHTGCRCRFSGSGVHIVELRMRNGANLSVGLLPASRRLCVLGMKERQQAEEMKRSLEKKFGEMVEAKALETN